MEQVLDDLIGVLQVQTGRNWLSVAQTWALRLAGNLITGIVIGVGIAIGLAFVG